MYFILFYFCLRMCPVLNCPSAGNAAFVAERRMGVEFLEVCQFGFILLYLKFCGDFSLRVSVPSLEMMGLSQVIFLTVCKSLAPLLSFGRQPWEMVPIQRRGAWRQARIFKYAMQTCPALHVTLDKRLLSSTKSQIRLEIQAVKRQSWKEDQGNHYFWTGQSNL